MKLFKKVYNSPKAEKLCGRRLNFDEITLLNVLALRQKKNLPVSSAELQDLIRSRKHTYHSILKFFHLRGITEHRTQYVFIAPGHVDNRQRYYFLNPEVLAEVLSKEFPVVKLAKLDLTPIEGLEDNSILSDDVTKAIARNLGKLTLDIQQLKQAAIEMDTFLILRKFISKIKSVKKSKKTGRISHLLLQAGSKALRQFLLINGKKPLDFDMVSAHWQLLAERLAPADTAKVKKWLKTGFYEKVMQGTGLTDRETVKEKIQQVLTNKRIHPIARKIRNFVFAELPSLKPYCESVWKQGKTVQCKLQRMESNLMNGICRILDKQGKWFIPFYDGIWIEEDSLDLLKTLFGYFVFERKN